MIWKLTFTTSAIALLALGAAIPAAAQTTQGPAEPSGAQLEEIVVTAQKRSESANAVPMSITAISQGDLLTQGVNNIAGLQKITPGFQVATGSLGAPVLTIRGVGFNEASIAATPTVGVYVDEAPLPFSSMTPIALLDVQRVEVLKGPQGTLFGQNTTGGTLNFIANKPTDTFKAGLDLTGDRFGRITAEGFVSGPLSSTLRARLAAKTEQGGAWQKGYVDGYLIGGTSRKGQKLGSANSIYTRAIVDWEPSDRAKIEVSLSYFKDKGEQQSPQFVGLSPLNPVLFDIYLAQFKTYPTAPANNRAADWDPSNKPRNDNEQIQGVIRGDFELSDTLTLTSITALAHYRQNPFFSIDGVSYENSKYQPHGVVDSVSQEVRLTGQLNERTNFILGGNYAKNHVDQQTLGLFFNNSNNAQFEAVFGERLLGTREKGNQHIEDIAAFGNVDFDLTDSLKLRGGIRYAKHNIDFEGCSADAGDGSFGRLFSPFATFFGGTPVPIAPGACATFDEVTILPTLYKRKFNEDNVSWRLGADYTIQRGLMVYANVSKGYKSGSFPITSAATTVALNPVTQESLMAYEAGFKATLLDRTLQLNGAAFYYDYKNKQVLIHTSVPVFGALQKLVNVPKSRITGAEMELNWLPVEGLHIKAAGTYLSSKVKKGVGNVFDIFNAPISLVGEQLPLTPKWQGNVDAEYTFSLGGGRPDAFFGGTVSGQTSSYGAFGENSELLIKKYAVLDLRAGIAAPDGSWRAMLWARNVTNKYYWTNADRIADNVVRWAGQPATFGMTLSLRTN